MFHLTSSIAELRARDFGSPLPLSPPTGDDGGEVLTAPKPDVRVVASASILVLPRRDATTVFAVAIQNHAPMAVHMASVNLSCADGTSMSLKHDATGRLNAPGTIESGKSWTFFYPGEDLREVQQQTQIVNAVAADQVGRVYTGDEESVQRVLKQLEVLASKPSARQSRSKRW